VSNGRSLVGDWAAQRRTQLAAEGRDERSEDVRVLVTAASRHQSTTEIAEAIARVLTESGISAASRRPDEVDSLEGYDAVVLGSGVYMGRWLSPATAFVERHRSALLERPVWLFSSGPLGSPQAKPDGDPSSVAELLAALQARGHRTFAGRLERKRLGLGEKLVAAGVKAPEGDFRPWQLIDAWAREIASALKVEPVLSRA
jgi:menaquinone-dependent protoporphyrinogen oxidase